MNSDENHTSRKPKWCKVIKHPGIKYVIKAVINGLIMLFTVSFKFSFWSTKVATLVVNCEILQQLIVESEEWVQVKKEFFIEKQRNLHGKIPKKSLYIVNIKKNFSFKL